MKLTSLMKCWEMMTQNPFSFLQTIPMLCSSHLTGSLENYNLRRKKKKKEATEAILQLPSFHLGHAGNGFYISMLTSFDVTESWTLRHSPLKLHTLKKET